ncbi:hypothetical protein SAMN05216359_105333 [Roseateles sp. YR242]|uniref:hypothetical protein n=1 Tax=Roseateles sp. YR242 TaxID=1855305 RepID=UPI0008D2D1D6|nr:hypothetical protein [Roseateles sp. YR242]SEL13699.1 hypothetical protein SAMN05216359_105333 [Roseateles sp. YR242]
MTTIEKQLAEALRGLDEAYCRAGTPLSKDERNEDRARLIAARDALAAYRQQEARGPLTDEQIEAGRKETFSTDNPFCPCTDKTMRKAVRWAEHAHGIKGE